MAQDSKTRSRKRDGKNRRDIAAVVREACFWMPEVEEKPSHGSPDFRVRGKPFASFVINHHGDGRVALWLRAPAGAQKLHCLRDPECYFVPPYVGPKGWLGVELNKSLTWERITEHLRDAYLEVAPKSLAAELGSAPRIKPPSTLPKPEEIDPFLSTKGQRLLKQMDERALGYPETNRGSQIGSPTWVAGKKTFASAYESNGRFSLSFWVGADRQDALAADPRFSIPAYTGHNGWISMDASGRVSWDEVDDLLEDSYRHFALKRMLKAMDGD